ncbi:succinyl-diaminopimelate desuccinylase [Candidatus Bodocaedibacter vickermanii]|uniref:Succinyl-diaminopimelate desuccinylase n=1 Tax=Candidatus Bodocaedibacter vickermanii TaxID=2741701 RepID=A0A7L9RU83_9PROT|nr:Succinyl-diaminopimelate desuccinylase [Candidatus Paracaedibacteraceae bacterium 'Lake Konstanz']
MLNLIDLCQRLIRFQSTTPQDDGIMNFLVQTLDSLGFSCHLLPHVDDQGSVVHNLYARRGTDSPNLCFAGHVDVVPSGAESSWTHPPFAGHIQDGAIWGRGAVDMKGSIAAFISAVINSEHKGSISFLITGDEEGAATHGTVKVIEWLKEHNEIIDFCIVGEPTSDEKLGDTIKVGRRGSLSGTLTVTGVQGHVAYPHKAENPIPNMLKLLTILNAETLDSGYDCFQPSNLEITSIDVANEASNVIPESISAKFNIRFNPSFTQLSLIERIQGALNVVDISYTLDFPNGSEPFLTNDHPAMEKLSQAIQEEVGLFPEYSTNGGTSDARFIKDIAPVVEFGLMNTFAHKVNEHVSLKDLETLARIYKRFIDLYFE